MTGNLEHEWDGDSSILDLIAWYFELVVQQASVEVEAEFGELSREGDRIERMPDRMLDAPSAGSRQVESRYRPVLNQADE
jgi:hypothetical protein